MSAEGTVVAPVFRYSAVTFDCGDPVQLAGFYGEMLGLPVVFATEDFVFLGQGEGVAGLGFSRLEGYRAPGWPGDGDGDGDGGVGGGGEKRAHVEVGVDDLDGAEAWLLELGAVKPDFQPDPERWRVLLDPAGHPFCISTLV
ncbi:VOC family protein [Streptomyces sp. Da 82-17]|uniref:VOC family protein n=1 Tax=Streptomyces sp. Da 82-17 TaxID=3377116 RepID=UPI0038D47019